MCYIALPDTYLDIAGRPWLISEDCMTLAVPPGPMRSIRFKDRIDTLPLFHYDRGLVGLGAFPIQSVQG